MEAIISKIFPTMTLQFLYKCLVLNVDRVGQRQEVEEVTDGRQPVSTALRHLFPTSTARPHLYILARAHFNSAAARVHPCYPCRTRPLASGSTGVTKTRKTRRCPAQRRRRSSARSSFRRASSGRCTSCSGKSRRCVPCTFSTLLLSLTTHTQPCSSLGLTCRDIENVRGREARRRAAAREDAAAPGGLRRVAAQTRAVRAGPARLILVVLGPAVESARLMTRRVTRPGQDVQEVLCPAWWTFS